MTTALERLAARIHHGRAAGFLSEEWERDIETAIAEARAQWLPEGQFRALTGATAAWCRRHFERYEAQGLARRDGRLRVWHRHARLPKHGTDPEALAHRIAGDWKAA